MRAFEDLKKIHICKLENKIIAVDTYDGRQILAEYIKCDECGSTSLVEVPVYSERSLNAQGKFILKLQ